VGLDLEVNWARDRTGACCCKHVVVVRCRRDASGATMSALARSLPLTKSSSALCSLRPVTVATIHMRSRFVHNMLILVIFMGEVADLTDSTAGLPVDQLCGGMAEQ
jgi:hypothetical protein